MRTFPFNRHNGSKVTCKTSQLSFKGPLKPPDDTNVIVNEVQVVAPEEGQEDMIYAVDTRGLVCKTKSPVSQPLSQHQGLKPAPSL